MKILFIGDIVGKGGRKAVTELAVKLRQEFGCGLVVANGENMAGGGGINGKCIRAITPAPMVDVITGGDHFWDRKEFLAEAGDFPQVLRPANMSPLQPGKGYGIFTAVGGEEVGVVCLQGRTFLNNQADSPFAAADKIVSEIRHRTSLIIVDFHAEATSEKLALGRYLDGRVSAVLGTHTHVPTADEQVFPGGTAYQTDVGMVGARESILGREIEPVVQKFATGMPARFNVVEKGIRMNATLLEAESATGKAISIKRIVRDL